MKRLAFAFYGLFVTGGFGLSSLFKTELQKINFMGYWFCGFFLLLMFSYFALFFKKNN